MPLRQEKNKFFVYVRYHVRGVMSVIKENERNSNRHDISPNFLPFTPFTAGRNPCTRLFPGRSVPPSVPQSLCESPLPKIHSFSYAFSS